MNGLIHNAEVDIRFDPKTKKFRASYGDGWVRFPKKLRQKGTRYVVGELRPGKAGSWIACGRIARDDRLPLERFFLDS